MTIQYHIENEYAPTFLDIDDDFVTLIQKDFNDDGTFAEATSVVVLSLDMLEKVLGKLKSHISADGTLFNTGETTRVN